MRTKRKIKRLKQWLNDHKAPETKCVNNWVKYLNETEISPDMQKHIVKQAEEIKYRINKVLELKMQGYNV